ncbi:conserved hypothetical protein [Trichinella spiralis]|uniref:hypothetical protein n=1 Tax=Trichinella spiralis TaxID=6334 RepID=UPI0001EFDC4D|nr:conserved hypothetical protein [Trichinella spiralis]
MAYSLVTHRDCDLSFHGFPLDFWTLFRIPADVWVDQHVFNGTRPIIGISDNRIDERKDSVNPSAYWIYQCRGKEFSALQKARLLTPPIRSVTTNYCIEAHAELRCYRHTFYMWLADSNPSPHDFWVGRLVKKGVHTPKLITICLWSSVDALKLLDGYPDTPFLC